MTTGRITQVTILKKAVEPTIPRDDQGSLPRDDVDVAPSSRPRHGATRG